MKSTIKIEFDFDKKEPYIHVVLKHSDDLRDQMLKSFLEKFSQGNNLMRVHFGEYSEFVNPSANVIGNAINNYTTVRMTPIEAAIKINDEENSPLLFPYVDEEGYIGVIPKEEVISVASNGSLLVDYKKEN